MVEFVLGLNCQFQNNMKKYSAVADKVMHMTCLFTLCFPISFNLQKTLWWFCCSVRVFPLLFWPFLLYSVLWVLPFRSFFQTSVSLRNVWCILLPCYLYWHNCSHKCNRKMVEVWKLEIICNKYLIISLILSLFFFNLK